MKRLVIGAATALAVALAGCGCGAAVATHSSSPSSVAHATGVPGTQGTQSPVQAAAMQQAWIKAKIVKAGMTFDPSGYGIDITGAPYASGDWPADRNSVPYGATATIYLGQPSAQAVDLYTLSGNDYALVEGTGPLGPWYAELTAVARGYRGAFTPAVAAQRLGGHVVTTTP
jgi:hypothetical protein